MIREQHSIVIARPIEVVFDYMDDVDKEREWQPNLREASQTPPGPSRAGTRKRYVSEFMGKKVVNTYEAEVVERPSRLVARTTPDSTVKASSEVRWESVEGGTRVTMTVEGQPSGVLRFFPKALLERAYKEEIRASLERLKKRLEQT